MATDLMSEQSGETTSKSRPIPISNTCSPESAENNLHIIRIFAEYNSYICRIEEQERQGTGETANIKLRSSWQSISISTGIGRE
jgi:hypothetical protein